MALFVVQLALAEPHSLCAVKLRETIGSGIAAIAGLALGCSVESYATARNREDDRQSGESDDSFVLCY
jgi:hypothetical protein